jgi:hypothetical protein
MDELIIYIALPFYLTHKKTVKNKRLTKHMKKRVKTRG